MSDGLYFWNAPPLHSSLLRATKRSILAPWPFSATSEPVNPLTPPHSHTSVPNRDLQSKNDAVQLLPFRLQAAVDGATRSSEETMFFLVAVLAPRKFECLGRVSSTPLPSALRASFRLLGGPRLLILLRIYHPSCTCAVTRVAASCEPVTDRNHCPSPLPLLLQCDQGFENEIWMSSLTGLTA